MDSNVEPEIRILSLKQPKDFQVELIAVYHSLAEAAATLRRLGQTSKAKLVESAIEPDCESDVSKILDALQIWDKPINRASLIDLLYQIYRLIDPLTVRKQDSQTTSNEHVTIILESRASEGLEELILALEKLQYGQVEEFLKPISYGQIGRNLSIAETKKRQNVLDLFNVMLRSGKFKSASDRQGLYRLFERKLGVSPRDLQDWKRNFHRRKPINSKIFPV